MKWRQPVQTMHSKTCLKREGEGGWALQQDETLDKQQEGPEQLGEFSFGEEWGNCWDRERQRQLWDAGEEWPFQFLLKEQVRSPPERSENGRGCVFMSVLFTLADLTTLIPLLPSWSAESQLSLSAFFQCHLLSFCGLDFVLMDGS